MIKIVTLQNGQELGSTGWSGTKEQAEAYVRSIQSAADDTARKLFWKKELLGIMFEVREFEGRGYAKATL